MAPEKKVIDASIIAKWFLEEEGSIKAIALRDAHISGSIVLVVPELAFIEVMNVLRYKKKSILELQKVGLALWNIQLQVEKLTEFVLLKSVQLAVKYKLSVYDGLYAFVSQMHGSSLVTADKALQKIPNAEIL